LLRAQLLQIFYSIRSERLLMEQLDYNLLFRWLSAWSWMNRSGTRRCGSPKPNGGAFSSVDTENRQLIDTSKPAIN